MKINAIILYTKHYGNAEKKATYNWHPAQHKVTGEDSSKDV